MAIQYAAPTVPLVQYDGTNSQEILDELAPYSSNVADIESEADGVVVFGKVGGAGLDLVEMSEGDYMIVSQFTLVKEADFNTKWISV